MVPPSMSTQPGGETAEAPKGPPLPKWLYRFVNPAMVALLRSPLHRVLSHAMMVLTFRGRKTGKSYTIPVGYAQQGDRVFIFSHSGWHVNLRSSAPVSLRLRGQQVRGTAEEVNEPGRIAEMQQALVAKNGEDMARRMGVLAPGASPADGKAPAGTWFIEIKLDEQS